MTIHLPEDAERIVVAEVLSGRFASFDEAIAEAVRLLQHRPSTANLPITEEDTEDKLERLMLEFGLLGSVPNPHDPTQPRREFQPIQVEGEPLSETVIRERR